MIIGEVMLRNALSPLCFAAALTLPLEAMAVAKADTTYRLTIVHTNDNHGRFWHNKHGEYGMPARKTLIDRIRAEVKSQGGQILVLSGGDINTGVPESDLQDAEPDFKGMSKIGYDAMALGNHEFDNPLSVLRKQQQWANFPMLSANIYEKGSNKRLFKPYQIFDMQGLKVAVMGLTTDDTGIVGNPEYIGNIDFRNPIKEAEKLVPELEKQADIIIAATHMGHYQNGNHGINAPGDVRLARQVNGIDMVVGGHSQDPVCMQAENQVIEKFKAGEACVPDVQNGTVIVQAHEWGKYVGRADLEYKNGELRLYSYQLIPVNLKKKVKVDGKKKRVHIQPEIAADQELQDFLEPYQAKGQKELEMVIGNSDGLLEGDRDIVRFRPSNLGTVIARAQMQAVNADLAVLNSGGIRDSIEGGDISYKDVLKVHPFGNMVSSVEMTGKELLEYLSVVASKPVDSGAFAHFAGLSMDVNGGSISNLTIQGQPLDTSKIYRMALNSYVASGGDGYPKVSDKPSYVNSGFVDADVLKNYLQKNTPLKISTYDPAGIVNRY
ncbi:bifunctional UDP-sugar hydrolase/5'-nucleotidase [Motiliproteus sp. MSK22-1]|nr:bifunctional UDP-sugar hydrolase/5'-nucleotidase [Motiliproteus sp. MSK22-1]